MAVFIRYLYPIILVFSLHSNSSNFDLNSLSTSDPRLAPATHAANFNHIHLDTVHSEKKTLKTAIFPSAKNNASKLVQIHPWVQLPEQVQNLYHEQNHLIWNASTAIVLEQQFKLLALSGLSQSIILQWQRLQQVKDHGLPHEYDQLLTDSLLIYLGYLDQLPKHGLVWLFDPSVDIPIYDPSFTSIDQFVDSMKNDQLKVFLSNLQSPVQKHRFFQASYQHLIKTTESKLATYHTPKLLRYGDQLENKQLLIQRLAIAGVDTDLQSLAITDFDQLFETRVKNFQRIHGLGQDGVIGPKTLRWINMSPMRRIQLLALNSERSRLWDKNREMIVFVNVPNFAMTYWFKGKSLFESKVIVGRKTRKTPIMTVDLNAVILNPTWKVPRKIMINDILPKAIADPMYLHDNHFQIIPHWGARTTIDPVTINWQQISPKNFPYKMRQSSGQHNALGLYKFNTPNPRAIYLHDTASKSLFNHSARAFSSGCVRVEQPHQFTKLLFESQGLTSRLERQQGSTATNLAISLKKHIPVHIVYQTVWLEGDELHYRDDIYQYDKQLNSTSMM